jgi:hypothetical protein
MSGLDTIRKALVILNCSSTSTLIEKLYESGKITNQEKEKIYNLRDTMIRVNPAISVWETNKGIMVANLILKAALKDDNLGKT